MLAMKDVRSTFFQLSMIALAPLVLGTFGVSAMGQEEPATNAKDVQASGIPEDWTHHHAVFSNPGTEEEAIRNGTHEQWLKIVTDPRYVVQQMRRHRAIQGPADALVPHAEGLRTEGVVPHQRVVNSIKVAKSKITKDWNTEMYHSGFGTEAAPSILAYPAKWSFNDTTASCANDFVIYPTGQAGLSGEQASIIAYYNMYTGGCSGTVPEVDWAYNTGGTVMLSPVFSFYGNQVAFVQTVGTAAYLVLLRFTTPGTSGAGTLISPVTPNVASSASNYYTGTGCATPCMYSVKLNSSTSSNDVESNPYYDYLTDSLYVGDANGLLYKFSPVFNGALTAAGSPWPVQLKNTVNDTNAAASPVYDITSGYVFVGTTSITTSTGGVLYAVGTGNQGTSSGSIHGYSGELDAEYGILDAPLLDSTAETVYVFAGYNPSGDTAVYKFPATFTSGSGTVAQLGLSGDGGTHAGDYQLAGTFDNGYYASGTSTPSGNLYVCGASSTGTLYQIPISSGTMGTAVTGPALAGVSGRCSPVTEFYNTSVPITATGTLTISGTVSTSWAGTTVTVGGTTYTFETSVGATANQVLLYTGSNAANNKARTAENLYAAINATSSQCYASPCFGSSTTANTSANATLSSDVVDLTAKSSGSVGDFLVSSSNTTDVTFSGGENGSNGTDYLFLSVYDGDLGSCDGTEGCLMSFDVTTPSNFNTALAPVGSVSIPSTTDVPPTGGIIIDNLVGSSTLVGASEIYFLTLDTTGNSPCAAGICAVQASQSAP